MPVLKILTGAREGDAVELSSDGLTIGRSPDNGIGLPNDSQLSRHHARLWRRGDAWVVEDLGSANGTFVERYNQAHRVVGPTPLIDGDVIVLGTLRAAISGIAGQPYQPAAAATTPSEPAGVVPQPAAYTPPPPPPEYAPQSTAWAGRPPQASDFQAVGRRLLRVAQLDQTAFHELRTEQSATLPAVAVVVLASLLSGLGGWLLYLSLVPDIARDSGEFFVRSVIVGTVVEAALWLAWVGTALLLLQQLWRRQVDFLALIRTMGLAFAPVGLSIFSFISGLALAVSLVSLAAAVLLSGLALEATVEASPRERLLANLAGFAVFALGLSLLGHNGHYAPGIFAYSF